MQVKVTLYGILRERLARESRGKLVLDLPPGCSIRDALMRLGIAPPVICVRNGANERNLDTPVEDGDELQFFHPVGGGAGHYNGANHGELTRYSERA